jgi:hypothetical protein
VDAATQLLPRYRGAANGTIDCEAKLQRQRGVQVENLPNGTRRAAVDGVAIADLIGVSMRQDIFESIKASAERRHDPAKKSTFANNPIPAAILGDI